MTMRPIYCDIVGEAYFGASTTHSIIGEATLFLDKDGSIDKTRFLLKINRAPLLYGRCFVVPGSILKLPSCLQVPFRVIDTSTTAAGKTHRYGMGKLMPASGSLSKGAYFELLPDEGHALWKCGVFAGEPDPYVMPDYFTFSEVAA